MTTYRMEPGQLSKHRLTGGTEVSGIVGDQKHRKEIFPHSQHPDGIWGPPSLLFYGSQGFLPRG